MVVVYESWWWRGKPGRDVEKLVEVLGGWCRCGEAIGGIERMVGAFKGCWRCREVA